MAEKVKLTFCGGTEGVTGANFWLTEESTGNQYLVDCGLFQGDHNWEANNQKPWLYEPSQIKALFVTHGHLDHIGRIPLLVKSGFHGPIYSTPPTKEIAELALKDALGLDETKSYHEDDIKDAMALWQGVDYHQPFKLGAMTVELFDAGHILGSAMYKFHWNDGAIVFTGDLGNTPAPLLQPTDAVTDAKYLIMESVYGDRNHEDRGSRRAQLEDVIEETMKAGGALVIPAFSIERTQEILYEIERMMEESRIPLVPVFLDSPLAISITAVYAKYQSYFNQSVKDIIKTDNQIFKFPQLHLSLSSRDSKAIFEANPRKIIMAGSGMSTGGRILHHEKAYLPDAKNTLLLIGYQGVGTMGRLLSEGAKEVRIFGERVPVRARIVQISGYSAHLDSEGLMNFVRGTSDTVKEVFAVMGEPKASLFLVQRLRDYLGVDARAPKLGESVTLEV